MAGDGSQPGERRGGRARGTPNKKTVQRAARRRRIEQAAAEVAKEIGVPGSVAEIAVRKAMENRRLAKEELEDVVPILRSIAAKHQAVAFAREPGTPQYKPAQWLELKQWLELYIDTCVSLADFQSPKYRAIVVAPAPDSSQPAQRKTFKLTVFEGGKAVAPLAIAPKAG